MSRVFALRFVLGVALVLTACSGDGGSAGPDGSNPPDAGAPDDAEVAGPDTGGGDALPSDTPAPPDAPDAAPDVAPDAAPDAVAPTDLTPADAAAELGDAAADFADAVPDAPPDVPDVPDLQYEVQTACDPRPMAPGEARAKPVACPDELIGGRMAIGRVGDYLLENARVRFIVRSGEAGHVLLGAAPGTVVDADLVRPDGVGRDELRELAPFFSTGIFAAPDARVRNPGGAREAVVEFSGTLIQHPFLANYLALPVPQAAVRLQYRLAPDADQLTLRIHVQPLATTGRVTVLAANTLFVGGRVDWFWPGLGFETAEATYQGGFVASAGPGVSYGFAVPAGTNLNMLDMDGLTVTTAQSIQAGQDGAFAEQYLLVGDGTVESLIATARALRGEAAVAVTGRLTPAVAADAPARTVTVFGSTGRSVTHTEAAPDGAYAFTLPPGDYTLVAGGAGLAEAAPVAISVSAGAPLDVAPIELPAAAFAAFAVNDADTAAPIPARVTLVDLDRPEVGERFLLIPPAAEPVAFAVTPGRYALTASRGPEYTIVQEAEFTVTAGATATRTFELRRVIDTTGWLAGDFHCHDEHSVDTVVPRTDRALACAAEGVDIHVATNHDFVANPSGWAAEAGVGDFLRSLPGVEMSSMDTGHMNAFPMPFDPNLAGNGAPVYFGMGPLDVYELLKAGDPVRVVQVNHPRDDAKALLPRMGFDAATGTVSGDPVEAGFDPQAVLDAWPFELFEVHNSSQHEVLRDYYALLNLGHRPTATGDSDSHGIGAFCGNARNYVYVGTDNPGAITPAEFTAALMAHRVTVSAGPFVTAALVDPTTGLDAAPGVTVSDTDGLATLHLRVQSPAYIGLQRVTVIQAGATVAEFLPDPPDPGVEVVVFEQTLDFPVTGDTWFNVEAEGLGSYWPVTRKTPLSFTNALFLDATGDGR